ncbi:MAG: recombinase family protein [Oscillospiraceae bacterium]
MVYRLDRISRNVGDFATLIEELNGMNTAFICIKEQFDTSNSDGQGYDEY